MHRLAAILLSCALWVPAAGSHAWVAPPVRPLPKPPVWPLPKPLPKPPAKVPAGKAAVEKNARQGTAKPTLQAEKAIDAAAPSQSFRLGNKDYLPHRGVDGRFQVDLGTIAAWQTHSRVLAVVQQSPLAVFARAHDGRYVAIGEAGNDDMWVRDAANAVTDTIGTALKRAVDNRIDSANIGRSVGAKTRAPPQARPGQLESEAKALLKALEDPEMLLRAKEWSVSHAAGVGGTSISDVDHVIVVEKPSQPATLTVSLVTSPSRGVPLRARVNLDEILKRIDKTDL